MTTLTAPRTLSTGRTIDRASHGSPTSSVPRPELRLHLTRRGRVVVVLAVLAALLALGFTLGHVGGSQAAGTATPATVVVQPGETLWSIAARVAPDRDPRGVVARLRSVNHLTGASVQVGERLVVPA